MKIRHYYGNQFQIDLTGKSLYFEKIILENEENVTKNIINYALCTNSRWLEGEEVLVKSQDAEAAISYVQILKDRFEEAEPFIARSKNTINLYISTLQDAKVKFNKEELLKTLEEYFLTYLNECVSGKQVWKSQHYSDPTPGLAASNYASEIKKTRWIEAEDIIMTDARSVYQYAKNILNSRWEEAESKILETEPENKHHWVLFDYLKELVRARWPEAEEIIKFHPHYAYNYAERYVRHRWEEAEPFIQQDPRYAFMYAKNFIGGRWPEAEEYIAQNPNLTYEYAKDIIGGKLPEEMHNRALILSMQYPNDNFLKKYFNYKKYRKETCKSK